MVVCSNTVAHRITAHHLCAFLLYLERQNKTKKLRALRYAAVGGGYAYEANTLINFSGARVMSALHTIKQNNRLSPDYALPEEYLRHILDKHCLEDTGAVLVPYLP